MAWPPRFAFVGGTVAIDFIQTGGEDFRAQWEGWHTPDDIADWAEMAPGIGVRPSVTDDEFKAAWALREALWRTVRNQLAGEPPEPDDHALIEALAAEPDLVPQWRNGKAVWASDATFTQVMSTVARDAIDLLGTSRVERFRKCANPMCYLMFVDNSRPGRRQWCTMERCGNLSKVARQREKRQRSGARQHSEGDGHGH